MMIKDFSFMLVLLALKAGFVMLIWNSTMVPYFNLPELPYLPVCGLMLMFRWLFGIDGIIIAVKELRDLITVKVEESSSLIRPLEEILEKYKEDK